MSDIVKKVVMLGEHSVGKTSLIRRYVYDIFSDEYINTIGTKITKKELDMAGTSLSLFIWDMLGEKKGSLHLAYYRGSAGGILVFDLTRRETFEEVRNWAEHFYRVAPGVPLVIAANKADLVDSMEVSIDEIEALSGEINAPFFLTSAKQGDGVERLFFTLASAIMERHRADRGENNGG